MHFHFCSANHNEVGRRTLDDMYQWFRVGLSALGHSVTLSDTEYEPRAVNVVWEYFMPGAAEALRDSGVRYGVIATEVFDGRGFNYLRDERFTQRWKGFCVAAEGASFIWSMVESNLPVFEWFAPSAYVELGFCEELCLKGSAEPDIDFSFLGFHTPYRTGLLDRLDKRCHVITPGKILSVSERNELILRTRINLSLKQSERWPIPSPTRTGLALMARRGLAAERTQIVTRQAEIGPMTPVGKDFVDFAMDQLNGPWREQADAAYERYRVELPMVRIMERVLDGTLTRVSSAQNGLAPFCSADQILAETAHGDAAGHVEALETRRSFAIITERLNQMQYGPAGDPKIAHLAGGYKGFNLVHFGGKVYGLRQALGLVNVTEGEAELLRRFGPNDILVADTPDVVKVRIDAIATNEELAALRAEMAALRSEAAIHGANGELLAPTQAIVARLNTLEAQLQARASQADLAAAAQAVGDRLDVLEVERQTQAASASNAAAARQVQIDEARATMQDLHSRLDAIARQQQLVARQVSLLQYGPGDPQKPCLAGEHRGFSLVHYHGRVHGLRKPLEPTEARLTEVLARNGASDAICGDSLDGVRARIDVLEDARELHAAMASLDRELLATDSRLAEGLRQANAALQANARDLERLARNWPNRVFGRFSK